MEQRRDGDGEKRSREDETLRLRASTIELSQRAIRNKLVYFCFVGGKRRGERR